MKPSVAIVGCGRMGTTLSRWLSEKGYPIVGLASKSLSSAKKAAEYAKSDRFSQINWEMTSAADLVFITTPDGIISDVCAEISRNKGFKEKAIVLHCSGAHPSTILSSAKNCGAAIGSMHPLQSMASAQIENNPFQGIIVSVEGESTALDAARNVAEGLGATYYTIKTEAKMLYHASAVVASNYLVTLLNLAFKLIEKAGITGNDAYNVLKPLIHGTLGNIEKIGIPAALTGPISRGDTQTIEQHLEAMKTNAPELTELYKTLGTDTIDIAKAAGTLNDDLAEKLGKILK